MSETILSGVFMLVGIVLGSVLTWAVNRKRNRLEIDKLREELEKLRLENEETRLRLNKQSERMRQLTERADGEVRSYVEILAADLSVCQNGLGLGRRVRMDDVFVWAGLENDGARRGECYKDDDLFALLLKNKTRALIVGGPGSGKSTVLRRWAHKTATDYLETGCGVLPLFIPLHQVGLFADKPGADLDVVEIALKTLYGSQAHSHPVLAAKLTEFVDNGRALIFLDAADEVPEAMRRSMGDWIDALSARNQVILTSRPRPELDGLSGFEKYNVVEFKRDQIDGLIGRWFGGLDRDAESKQDIANCVLKSPLVLKSNPLFLTMLCVVTERGGETAPSPGALFEGFVRELLEPRARKHQLSIQTHLKLSLLQHIACSLSERDRKAIQEEQLLDMLRDFDLPDPGPADARGAATVLKEIVETSGIVQFGRSGFYSFYHPLFQDFFVARKLVHDMRKGLVDESAWLAKHAFEDTDGKVFAFVHELLDFERQEEGSVK